MKNISLKGNLFIIILMIIVVPLAGELKLYPFPNTFRISFGIPIFFLLLLGIRRIPLVICGILVGASVILFRIALDSSTGGLLFDYSFTLHFPTFFYYITYSYMFHITRLNNLHRHPLVVGLLSVIIETASSIVELSIRHYFLRDIITLPILNEVVIIAIIRSFFALGFFYAIKLHEAEISSIQQQKQNRHMLLLISGLYEESIQLKKSLKDAEEITRDCYELYQNLLNNKCSLSSEELTQKYWALLVKYMKSKRITKESILGLLR
ncbi:hypothetical protein [Clostridium sp. OS1-26]|uniref:hypothetical protein n=1 Tax=Clostridium sp. OS1-26 TaxID=3070681 RepID=UPI0027E14C31|nr:hypothetical protein [Clostridium sp. OS1-26]WML36141.1 hypothetical protein RCG18_05325 [Clostridium sp. OS1-26]